MNVGADVWSTQDHGMVSSCGRFEIHAAIKRHFEGRKDEVLRCGVDGIANVQRKIGCAAEELKTDVQTIGSNGARRLADHSEELLLDSTDGDNSCGRREERQEEIAQRAGVAGETRERELSGHGGGDQWKSCEDCAGSSSSRKGSTLSAFTWMTLETFWTGPVMRSDDSWVIVRRCFSKKSE